MKLYRGDSVPKSVQASNRTSRGRSFAEHFIGAGLCSKFIDGGKSSLLAGKSLTAQIVAHVGYLPGSSSSEFSYRSPMLSFSPNRDLAMAYAERDAAKRALLTGCDYEQATHFRWQLVGVDNPTSVPGVHVFDYVEDFSNVRSINQDMLHRGFAQEAATGDMELFAKALMNVIVDAKAQAIPRRHSALLINVSEHLALADVSGCNPVEVDRARKHASRDDEWLVYPCTSMPDGHGVSARLAMNTNLSVDSWWRLP